jgi:hypothetical protein
MDRQRRPRLQHLDSLHPRRPQDCQLDPCRTPSCRRHRTPSQKLNEPYAPAQTRYGRAVDVKRAAGLYAQGRTLRQIGAELGVTADTIRWHLRQAGVAMRPPGRPKATNARARPLIGVTSSLPPWLSRRPSASAAPSSVSCVVHLRGQRSPQQGAPPIALLPADKRRSTASNRLGRTAGEGARI